MSILQLNDTFLVQGLDEWTQPSKKWQSREKNQYISSVKKIKII